MTSDTFRFSSLSCCLTELAAVKPRSMEKSTSILPQCQASLGLDTDGEAFLDASGLETLVRWDWFRSSCTDPRLRFASASVVRSNSLAVVRAKFSEPGAVAG